MPAIAVLRPGFDLFRDNMPSTSPAILAIIAPTQGNNPVEIKGANLSAVNKTDNIPSINDAIAMLYPAFRRIKTYRTRDRTAVPGRIRIPDSLLRRKILHNVNSCHYFSFRFVFDIVLFNKLNSIMRLCISRFALSAILVISSQEFKSLQ